uniref:Uncharacterized protein n=1 Tax=Periophthalmus magnuspinnatus TaxID=409849 RepID=A0A3B4AVQ8_9GOBI
MMDLLNSQLLDKMNNNLRLYFEDEPRAASLSTSVTGITGPPSHCPSKRKYREQMEDQMNSDDDHMAKMRLFASQMVRPAAAENNRNEHWSYNPIPVEHLSASNGLHGNHLFASIPGFAVDQPLALTKSTVDPAAGGMDRPVTAGSAERQQNRPSVIICAPASNRNCNLSHCHMNGSTGQESDQKKANKCDPVIEEHFRRSLGKNYSEPESNSVSITGSVDDHFAKALGATWLQIKAKGPSAPEPDP